MPIPIWIGGASKPALRRTATVADGWLGGGGSLEEMITLLEQVRELREEAGRDELPFETITLHAVGLEKNFDDVRRLEAEIRELEASMAPGEASPSLLDRYGHLQTGFGGVEGAHFLHLVTGDLDFIVAR